MNLNRYDRTPTVATSLRARLFRKARPALFVTLAAMTAGSALAEVAPQLFGVNLANGDSSSGGNVPGVYGYDYLYPSESHLDYYKSKGMTLIRLNIKWKRIQDAPGQPLDETDMVMIDNVIAMAKQRGMQVILDLHDYNSYGKNAAGENLIIGEHPDAPAISTLVQLWGLIAERYKNESAVYGYDLMNEPKGSVTNWMNIAQQLITEIRNHDTKTWILVEGIFSSRAWGWEKDGNGVLGGLTDSASRLIFSAHSYWDKGGSGTYANSYATDARTDQSGVDHVKPFVAWCEANGFNGLIGEYGVPWNKGYVNEWNTVTENFMNYIKAHGLSGTYWRGGPGQEGYQLTADPSSTTGERPVMGILKNYHNLTGPSEVIVDNSHFGNITLVPTTGGWTKVSGTNSGYAGDFLHDGGAGKGSRSATFSPNILFAGNYEVSIRWKQASNRATNVPVTVTHAGGTATLPPLDQTGSGDTWVPLGTYFFNAGTTGNVKITNTGTTAGLLVIADAVKFTPTVSLPTGWSSADVGAVGVPGSATYSGGVYTVSGSGATIGGTLDAFQFASISKSGDCTITARVVSQTNTSQYARAGVMIRDASGANAMFADAILTPSNGTYLQSRLTTGATAVTTSTGAGAAPYWVRVTRVGNVFTAYKSTTGASGSWVQMSTPKTITMPTSVKVGLAVCSFANTTLGTAVFDNVTVTP